MELNGSARSRIRERSKCLVDLLRELDRLFIFLNHDQAPHFVVKRFIEISKYSDLDPINFIDLISHSLPVEFRLATATRINQVCQIVDNVAGCLKCRVFIDFLFPQVGRKTAPIRDALTSTNYGSLKFLLCLFESPLR